MHGYLEIYEMLWVILQMTNVLVSQNHSDSDSKVGQWV